MKKGIIACLIASVIIGNPLTFQLPRTPEFRQATIIGKISPVSGATSVWLVGAKDSLRSNVIEGSFSQLVHPGYYKLIIEARGPFKKAILDNLDVKQNQVLDIGEIILQK